MHPVHTIILARWYIAREVYVTYILWKELKKENNTRKVSSSVSYERRWIMAIQNEEIWLEGTQNSSRCLGSWRSIFSFYTSDWKHIRGWHEFLIEKSDVILIYNIVLISLIDEMLQSELKLDGLTLSTIYHHDRPNNYCNTKGKIITFQSGIDDNFELYNDVETLVLKSELLLETIVLKRNPNENRIIAEMAKLIANSNAEASDSDSQLNQSCSVVIHSLK